MKRIEGRKHAKRVALYQWFLFTLLGAICFALAAGCSSSTPNTATANPAAASVSAGSAEPCSLITQAEVETALGKGATITPYPNPRTGMKECRLKPAKAAGVEEVIIVIHDANQWEAIKKAMLPPSSDAKAVPGLGDDAFVGRAIGYNVRKGNKYVQVFGPVTNNEAANDKATRYLAERAASRL